MLVRALLATSLVLLVACSSSEPLQAGSAGAGSGDGGDGGSAGQTAISATRTVTVFDGARISSNASDPSFQELSADLDLSAGPFARATLVADLGTTCFPFSSWANDPPPKGQNWPADCDAFDRNFEISLDGPEPGEMSHPVPLGDGGAAGEGGASSTGATGGDSGASGDGGAISIASDASSAPGLELVRAITPFGGPLHVERDLTAVANGLPGQHRIHVRINTWSDPAGLVTGSNAGWNVNLKLVLSAGSSQLAPLAVVPLFYGDVTSAAPITTSFTIPKGTGRGYLEYRTTGHGSAVGNALECSGPAEEFCKREHTIELDGVTLKSFTPWKTCAANCTLAKTQGDPGVDYCEENPCGAVQSVRAPRANWCPGTETEPVTIDAPELARAGQHDVSFRVSEVADGGSVRVSLTYYALAQ